MASRSSAKLSFVASTVLVTWLEMETWPSSVPNSCRGQRAPGQPQTPPPDSFKQGHRSPGPARPAAAAHHELGIYWVVLKLTRLVPAPQRGGFPRLDEVAGGAHSQKDCTGRAQFRTGQFGFPHRPLSSPTDTPRDIRRAPWATRTPLHSPQSSRSSQQVGACVVSL